jgi:hypothetical protein
MLLMPADAGSERYNTIRFILLVPTLSSRVLVTVLIRIPYKQRRVVVFQTASKVMYKQLENDMGE